MIHPLISFARSVWEENDIIEIRAIGPAPTPGAKRPAEKLGWWTAAQLCGESPISALAARNASGWCIYAGINPRSEKGGATADKVAIARCFFVDFDGGVTPDDARRRIRAITLPEPTVVVASGHGTHCYWRLTEPMTDLNLWTRYQKRLINLLGSDGVIHDSPRIMRLPGFTNMKDAPVPAELVEFASERRHPLAAFPLESEQPATKAHGTPISDSGWRSRLSRASMNFMLNGASGGERNSRLYKAACDAAGCGATHAEAEAALIAPGMNSPGDHSFSEQEARDTIGSAFAKPRTPSRPEVAASEPEPDEDDPEAGTQAERLVRLAQELFRFGRTTANEPFAVRRNGPNIALLIRSGARALLASLCKDYRTRYGKIPNAAARTDALMVLEGECTDQEPEEVFLRVARHESAIIIDLGRSDGQVVGIKDGRWDILPVSPVLFRRTVLTSPMPIPEQGGELEEFRQLVNITAEDWELFLGWWVSGWCPGIPHSMLMLGGEQGTGKSTCARFAVQVIDPSPAPLRSPPRCLDDWVVAASGSWVVVLDNLSNIPEWLADAICRAVTGEGLVKRALFTDSELAVLVFRRVVVITSIDPGALRGDMGDRLIAVELERIEEQHRLDDAELEEEFSRRLPRIFGALLDLAARVFAEMPTVKLASRPRMADFARVLGAVDVVLGSKTVELFMEQRGRIAGSVVETSPLARAIVDHIGQVAFWEGTAGELYGLLTPTKPVLEWPKSATGMGGQLRRLAPVLGQVGVEVIVPKPKDKLRRYTLRRLQNPPETTAQTAQPPEESAPDVGNGDSGRAVGSSSDANRPCNRPNGDLQNEAENGDSGRLGGSGGQIPSVLKMDVAPGPPHRCYACGGLNWWSVSGLMYWTCGSCHAPPPQNGPVIRWHGNEKAA